MISYIALMIYIIAFSNILLFFTLGSRILKTFFNIFMGLGCLVNIVELLAVWCHSGNFPTFSIFGFISIISAAFVVTYFILYIKFERPLVGMFISPFNIIFSIIAIVYFPTTLEYPTTAIVDSVWKYGHLPFVILGSTFFIASFLSSIMYLFQERQLKGKNFGKIFQRFPPLDTINSITSSSLKIGFYFFTIGILLGFAWIIDDGLENILISLKVVFSIITWVVFSIIISVKHYKGLSPHKIAVLTILGFLSMLIAYIGVAVFLIR